MMNDMGTFRIDVTIENTAGARERASFSSVLVDTGAELSVFPGATLEDIGIERLKQLRFRQADGSVTTRWTGSARVYAADTVATDDVVFGEPGDLTLLGAITRGVEPQGRSDLQAARGRGADAVGGNRMRSQGRVGNEGLFGTMPRRPSFPPLRG